MANIKISDLTSAPAINGSTMLLVSTVDTSTTPPTITSYKTTFDDLATLILSNINYTTQLNTTDKTIFGAINELKAAQ